jgi:predicted aldo/keto reductase-like oxidoreductase
MRVFDNVKKNFGFGCMRLPMLSNGTVNIEEFSLMVDEYIKAGFNYFDTAHGYLDGESEKAIKKALVDRYERSDYILVNKLSAWLFDSENDIRPLFQSQLEACGVDYFDIYLLHAQNKSNYKKCIENNAYNTIRELIGEGKIRHFGISFHDTAEFLDKILTENPDIELVQLQFNYFDYENENVQGKLCYEVCLKHNKPVVVMEPVRGGSLVNLVDEADAILKGLGNGSNASYAIRYSASFENVKMVLSGMSNIEQMRDNLSYMINFKPLNEKEFEAVYRVADIIRSKTVVPCTSCAYCVTECPMNIKIPKIFSCLNREAMFNCSTKSSYEQITKGGSLASSCIGCGSCETVCPQKIKIRDMLAIAANKYE